MEKLECVSCQDHICKEGIDCYNTAESALQLCNESSFLEKKLLHTAAQVESKGYMRWPRALEIIRFAEMAGFSHLGLAFCVGLAEETRIFVEMIGYRFEVSSVCCKVGGVYESSLDLEKLNPSKFDDVMCSPLNQAELLNQANCDFNIMIGLCVGHDALFSRRSEAPVTTLIAKDKILGHNPAVALYSRYWKNKLLMEK